MDGKIEIDEKYQQESGSNQRQRKVQMWECDMEQTERTKYKIKY